MLTQQVTKLKKKERGGAKNENPSPCLGQWTVWERGEDANASRLRACSHRGVLMGKPDPFKLVFRSQFHTSGPLVFFVYYELACIGTSCKWSSEWGFPTGRINPT